MSKHRIKIVGPAIKSRAQMEEVVGQIAEAKINQQIKTGEMDARILAVREEFEDELAGYAQDIQLLMAAAAAWAEANPAEFGKGKSIDMVHATVGFRTGQPQLKTLRGWTWEKVLQAIKRFAWRRFIRDQAGSQQGSDPQRPGAARHQDGGHWRPRGPGGEFFRRA